MFSWQFEILVDDIWILGGTECCNHIHSEQYKLLNHINPWISISMLLGFILANTVFFAYFGVIYIYITGNIGVETLDLSRKCFVPQSPQINVQFFF